MGKLNIKKLVLNNFRSFKGRHEISFNSNGLCIILGPSGSGKSNILVGLAYAMGYCPYPAKDLQCWLTEDPFSVELHLQHGPDSIVLTRGGGKVSLDINGDKVKGGAKAVEERLDQICGVGAELREAITYRDQIEPKSFIHMKDSEIKEFLTTVLGLHKLEKEVEVVTKKVGELLNKLEVDCHQLASWERDAAADLVQPSVPQKEDTQELELFVSNLESSLNDKAARLKDVEEQIKETRTKLRADCESAMAVELTKAKALQEEASSILLTPPPVADTTELEEAQRAVAECAEHIALINANDAMRRTEIKFKTKPNDCKRCTIRSNRSCERLTTQKNNSV
jgi:DNA repair exonuclease SbcCD ATPase subunit